MEQTTLFLAQLIGPVMLAVGAGIFFSRDYYMKVYRHLENETLAVFVSGITALVIGIVMVMSHNVWSSLITYIISLVGWLSIAKGLLLIITPKTVSKMGDAFAKSPSMFTFAGLLYTILGVYVSYMAYFAV